jgi:hypothetical protein
VDDELSPRARQLLDYALAQDLPAPGVAEDSWGMVISRVTSETERSRADGERATTTDRPRSRRLGVVVALLAAMIMTAIGLERARDPAAAAVLPAPEPARPATRTPVPAATPSSATSDVPRLLDQAEVAALSAPDRALVLLDRHAALAPALDPDRRMALRVEVLCALGRTDEAAAEATAFLARARAEPWADRVRASCGAPAAAEAR